MATRHGKRRAAQGGILALAALLLAGCGAAGSSERVIRGGGEILAGLRVLTVALPVGHVGATYEPVQLEVDGAPATAVRWSLWQGDLPAGLDLSASGRLTGRPTHAGFTAFTVHVTDGRLAGTGTLALAVDAFGFVVQSGLVGAEAWSGRPVALRAAGQEGPVGFEIAVNRTGGRLTTVDAVAGTATWLPGPPRDGMATDVLRATDLATDRTYDVEIDVCPDPLDGHVARFGSTDVWYVNGDVKYGAHAFATDLHAALAKVGLRAPGSTDMIGTEADRLAALWVRLEMLRNLNRLYLRETDGRAGASGLPVSFPFDEPGPGYAKPAAGTWIEGASNRFSEIALLQGTSMTVVGTAFVDDDRNALHENDASVPAEELGVFVNAIAFYFGAVFPHRPLRKDPIGPDDVPALRALLHGLPSPGGRYEEIGAAGRDFGRVLATVVAHEIGHSLGLPHAAAGDVGALMSPSATISPFVDPQFHAAELAGLRARLPGPGRHGPLDVSGKPEGTSAALPAGGVCDCSRQRCDLRVPALVPARADR